MGRLRKLGRLFCFLGKLFAVVGEDANNGKRILLKQQRPAVAEPLSMNSMDSATGKKAKQEAGADQPAVVGVLANNNRKQVS